MSLYSSASIRNSLFKTHTLIHTHTHARARSQTDTGAGCCLAGAQTPSLERAYASSLLDDEAVMETMCVWGTAANRRHNRPASELTALKQ